MSVKKGRLPIFFLKLLLATLAIGGCSSLPPQANRATLMPDPVAKNVLAGYFGEQWVSSPYYYPDAFCPQSKSEKMYFSYEKIFRVRTIGNRLRVSAGDNQWLPCSYGVIWVDRASKSDVEKIEQALVGMGATHFQRNEVE